SAGSAEPFGLPSPPPSRPPHFVRTFAPGLSRIGHRGPGCRSHFPLLNSMFTTGHGVQNKTHCSERRNDGDANDRTRRVRTQTVNVGREAGNPEPFEKGRLTMNSTSRLSLISVVLTTLCITGNHLFTIGAGAYALG